MQLVLVAAGAGKRTDDMNEYLDSKALYALDTVLLGVL